MINLKSAKKIKASRAVVFFLCLLVLVPQFLFGQDKETLKGETKIEDSQPSAENVLMGNISAGRSADKVAAAIKFYDSNIKSIVIYNKEQAEMLAGYEKTRSQLENLLSRYSALINKQENIINNLGNQPCTERQSDNSNKSTEMKSITESFTTGVDLVSGAVGSFVGLLSYFRTNVELRPEVFDIEDKVIIAEVFRALRQEYGNQIKLYNSNSIPPKFSESELIKLLEAVIKLNETASNNNDRIKEELPRITCLAAKSPTDLIRKRNLMRAIADYDNNKQQLEAIVTGLTGDLPEKKKSEKDSDKDSDNETTPPQPKPNYLTAYLCVENIYQLMRNNNDGYWLEIKAVKAGGTTRVKTNLIVDVFTGGNRVSHSGASLVQYNLYDNTGMSVLSGIVPDYIPYTKPKKIPDLVKTTEEKLAQKQKKDSNTQVTKNTSQNNSKKKNQ